MRGRVRRRKGGGNGPVVPLFPPGFGAKLREYGRRFYRLAEDNPFFGGVIFGCHLFLFSAGLALVGLCVWVMLFALGRVFA